MIIISPLSIDEGLCIYESHSLDHFIRKSSKKKILVDEMMLKLKSSPFKNVRVFVEKLVEVTSTFLAKKLPHLYR